MSDRNVAHCDNSWSEGSTTIVKPNQEFHAQHSIFTLKYLGTILYETDTCPFPFFFWENVRKISLTHVCAVVDNSQSFLYEYHYKNDHQTEQK